MARLEKQMQFLLEIDKMKSVFRQNYLADGSRRENDSEHSWHLAMMVYVLAEHFDGIDELKTIKMVLLHDIIEIYAGDTFAYDEEGYLDKDEREQKAAQKIFALLPSEQSVEFTDLWDEFERIDTDEAVCAAIVDRVQPLTLNIASKGIMWQKHKVTIEKVLKRNELVFDKAPKIISDYVRRIINEAAANRYFYKDE
ncbi:MAG: HD domain-containing protein [Saccharofermentanales bacterium]